jgi:PII-like signaling protein
MKLVRIYVSQNNRRWHEDIPYGDHLERAAELEMEGAHIYHASMVDARVQTAKRRNRATLKQRAY